MAHTAFSTDIWPFDGATFKRALPAQRHYRELARVVNKLGALQGTIYGEPWPDVEVPRLPGWRHGTMLREAIEAILNTASATTIHFVKSDGYNNLGRYVVKAEPGEGEINILADLGIAGPDGLWRPGYRQQDIARKSMLNDPYLVLNALRWIALPVVDTPACHPYNADIWTWDAPTPYPEDVVWLDLKTAQIPSAARWTDEGGGENSERIARGLCGRKWTYQDPQFDKFDFWYMSTWLHGFYDKWKARCGWAAGYAPADLGGIDLADAFMWIVPNEDDAGFAVWEGFGADYRARGTAVVEFRHAGGAARDECPETDSAGEPWGYALVLEADVDAGTGVDLEVGWQDANQRTQVPDDTEYPQPVSVLTVVTPRHFANFFRCTPWACIEVDVLAAD